VAPGGLNLIREVAPGLHEIIEDGATRFAFAVHRQGSLVIGTAIVAGTAGLANVAMIVGLTTSYAAWSRIHPGLTVAFTMLAVLSFAVYFVTPFASMRGVKRALPIEWFVAWRLVGVAGSAARRMMEDDVLWGSEYARILDQLLRLPRAYGSQALSRGLRRSAERTLESRISSLRDAVVLMATSGVIDEYQVKRVVLGVATAAFAPANHSVSASSEEPVGWRRAQTAVGMIVLAAGSLFFGVIVAVPLATLISPAVAGVAGAVLASIAGQVAARMMARRLDD